MTVMTLESNRWLFMNTQGVAGHLKHPLFSHGGLLLFVGQPNLMRSPPLMFGVLSSLAAAGERPDALPQAAECTDRPGLSQTQTGQKTVTPFNELFLVSSQFRKLFTVQVI